MREIKFRAWDGKEIWKVTGVQFANNSDFVNLYGTEPEWIATGIYENKTSKRLMFMSSPDCELMQYTGLKDKNGVEIYEGDIVSHGGEWNASVDFGELKFWGGYDSDDYYGIGFRVGSMPLDPRGEPLEYIVIGNIYENPELLKGDTKL